MEIPFLVIGGLLNLFIFIWFLATISSIASNTKKASALLGDANKLQKKLLSAIEASEQHLMEVRLSNQLVCDHLRAEKP